MPHSKAIPSVLGGLVLLLLPALAFAMPAAPSVPVDASSAAPSEIALPVSDAAGPLAGGDLNLLDLIIHASLPVKLVMALLLFGSIVSWMIIFRRKFVLDGAASSADRFEERFWSGADLTTLFREAGEKDRQVVGLEAIFEAGFREFARLRQKRNIDPRTQLEGAQRAMRAQLAREVDGLDHNLEFLANVGSNAPYVGLFGTVWGIMISFQGLANVKEATIATVAPGISEALIATAMGLFAAIPAVWAYNRYSNKVERLSVRYEAFAEEFSSILQRHSHAEEH